MDQTQARGNGARYIKKSRDHLLPATSITSRYHLTSPYLTRACVAPWPGQLFCRVLCASGAGCYQWRGRVQHAAAPW